MFDEYFEEFDPFKRKKILDSLHEKADSGTLSDSEQADLEQISNLFTLHYEENKDGGYNDCYVGALLKLLHVANVPGDSFADKSNAALADEAIHTLCLDQVDKFSDEILYRELCQVISVYITFSINNALFQSIPLRIRRKNGNKAKEKIQQDLQLMQEQVLACLGESDGYFLFQKAIEETMSEKLKP